MGSNAAILLISNIFCLNSANWMKTFRENSIDMHKEDIKHQCIPICAFETIKTAFLYEDVCPLTNFSSRFSERYQICWQTIGNKTWNRAINGLKRDPFIVKTLHREVSVMFQKFLQVWMILGLRCAWDKLFLGIVRFGIAETSCAWIWSRTLIHGGGVICHLLPEIEIRY